MRMRGEGKSKEAGVIGGKFGKRRTAGDEVVDRPGSRSHRGLGTGVGTLGFVLSPKGNKWKVYEHESDQIRPAFEMVHSGNDL